MKTQSFSFKSPLSVITHLRGLAEFATYIQGSNLPLSDFDLDSVDLIEFLSFFRKYSMSKPLYLVYRSMGFGFFNSSAEAVIYKRDYIKSFIASYVVRYSPSDDVFTVEPTLLC